MSSPPDSSFFTPTCQVFSIPQLDGNLSFSSSCSFTSSSMDLLQLSSSTTSLDKSWYSQKSHCGTTLSHCNESENYIPVFTGHRPEPEHITRQPPVRKVIRRENRCIQALSLPTILSYNMRSLWGKIRSLATVIHERSWEIIFLSEVWEKRENKSHKHKIEELLEMSNISYISTPRQGSKRGGGAAIAISSNKFSVKKLNIFIPTPLEIVWAMLRPIEHTGDIRKITSRTEQGHTRVPSISFHFDLSKIPSWLCSPNCKNSI